MSSSHMFDIGNWLHGYVCRFVEYHTVKYRLIKGRISVSMIPCQYLAITLYTHSHHSLQCGVSCISRSLDCSDSRYQNCEISPSDRLPWPPVHCGPADPWPGDSGGQTLHIAPS